MMRWILATLPLFLVAAPVAAQSKTTQISKKYGWLDNLAAGKALAQMTGKPLMVVFRCDP